MSSQSQQFGTATAQAQQSAHQLKQQAQQSYGQARSSVVDRAKQAHTSVVMPAVSRYVELVQRRPMLLTFATLFLLTSAIPLISFAVFSLGTLAVIGGSAFAFTLFWSGILISAAATMLGLTLAVTSLISATLGFWVIGGYALVRLFANVSVASSLGRGIQNFNNEMRELVTGQQQIKTNPFSGVNNGQSITEDIKAQFGSDSKVTQ